jgi:transcriptional regulator with XRE-family HTH domain
MPLNPTRIRQLRLQAGLTLQQAADKAGLTNRQKWARLEAGGVPDPQISTLERIARALGVSVGELLR